MTRKSRQRFMQLGIVIAILLAIGVLFIFQSRIVQFKVHDRQRIQDIQQLATLIERYYDDHGNYPSALAALVDEGYLGTMVYDPLSHRPYGYIVAPTGLGYQVYSELADGFKRTDVLIHDADITTSWSIDGTNETCAQLTRAQDCIYDLGQE